MTPGGSGRRDRAMAPADTSPRRACGDANGDSGLGEAARNQAASLQNRTNGAKQPVQNGPTAFQFFLAVPACFASIELPRMRCPAPLARSSRPSDQLLQSLRALQESKPLNGPSINELHELHGTSRSRTFNHNDDANASQCKGQVRLMLLARMLSSIKFPTVRASSGRLGCRPSQVHSHRRSRPAA